MGHALGGGRVGRHKGRLGFGLKDDRVIAPVFKYIQDVKPDFVIVLGDWLDFPQLTTKFLRKATDPDQLMKDIAGARDDLVELQKWT